MPGPGEDAPVVWYPGTVLTAQRWYHTDERGSIIALSNSTGASIATNRYDEYGLPQAGNTGAYQYTGQIWLPELGVYHYKARMYAPSAARFMQTDPIGMAGGVNLYAYVKGDPVNWVDGAGTSKTRPTTQPKTSDKQNGKECDGCTIFVDGERPRTDTLAIGTFALVTGGPGQGTATGRDGVSGGGSAAAPKPGQRPLPVKKPAQKPRKTKSATCQIAEAAQIAGASAVVTGGVMVGVGLLTGPGELALGPIGGAIAFAGGVYGSAGWLLEKAGSCK